MTFRNKYLFIVVALVCLAGLIKQLIDYYREGGSLEVQHKSSTIIVKHKNRSCNCPEWTIVGSEGTEKYFYLEPAALDLPLPEDLAARIDSLSIIKLEGRFHAEKGIPDYYPETDTKTEPASVFRYTGFYIIKPEQRSR